MHHHPQNQGRAVNLSIQLVAGLRKFPREAAPWQHCAWLIKRVTTQVVVTTRTSLIHAPAFTCGGLWLLHSEVMQAVFDDPVNHYNCMDCGLYTVDAPSKFLTYQLPMQPWG